MPVTKIQIDTTKTLLEAEKVVSRLYPIIEGHEFNMALTITPINDMFGVFVVTDAELDEDNEEQLLYETVNSLLIQEIVADPPITSRYSEIFRTLYSTLTTSQIDRALRYAGATHQEWLSFCDHMKSPPTTLQTIIKEYVEQEIEKRNIEPLDDEEMRVAIAGVEYHISEELPRSAEVSVQNVLYDRKREVEA